MARCYKEDSKDSKDGKYKEAIEDLSHAIYLSSSIRHIGKAYYYRAYAYYLANNYERALSDCNARDPFGNFFIKQPERGELLGKIYSAMSSYSEAVINFKEALKWYIGNYVKSPPELIQLYQEACKRMSNV
ncbi:hypothetical protein ACYULU_08290 [Breznakiellaceae bacterium SP9]